MSTLDARLPDSAHAGPYLAPADLSALSRAVKKAGLKLVHIDLSGVRDKQHLLDAVAVAFRFPEWFGGNWDALEDCLTDLSWNKAGGYVALFEHAGDLATIAPHELATAVEIFESVAEYWDEQEIPFWTLFAGIDTPVAGIHPLHV
jgi:RNAse (barnase) inhibitor barstar